MDTLVLSASWEPVARVPWTRAITLLWEKKAEVVETYEDRTVRSPTQEWKVPSIIRFYTWTRPKRKGVKFSRENIYARDGGKCQYCADKVSREDFTYDHVTPVSKGGQTVWTNIVVSCTPCNQKKGGRTPEQAGMKLAKVPRKPTRSELPESLLFRLSWRPGMPESWKNWLVSGAYWKAELDHDDQ